MYFYVARFLVYKIKIKISCMYSSNKQNKNLKDTVGKCICSKYNSTEGLHLPPYFVLSTPKLYAL